MSKVNIENVKAISKLKNSGKTWEEISSELNIPIKTARSRWTRIRSRSKTIGKVFDSNFKYWDNNELAVLDYFLGLKKSYVYIAEKMKKTSESVRHKAMRVDWKAWRLINSDLIKDVHDHVDKYIGLSDNEIETEEENMVRERAIDSLLVISRYSASRLNKITKNEFISKVNIDKKNRDINFNEIKELANKKLDDLGFTNPSEKELKKGTYVIVGDSHGKHTNKEVFKLLKNFCNYLKPNNVIHIGHILDDDNDISYDWGGFKNLIILSKIEELRIVQGQRNRFDFNYDVIKECVKIGNLMVTNQDIISDYVKTPISGLDSEIFDDRSIVNSHRLEFSTRCTNDEISYVGSPGCLCDKHITRTIKQIDFHDGRVIKQAFHEGFSKYRRMNHMCEYWKNGLMVIHVDSDGNTTVVPCSIKKVNKGYAISYFDKIITSNSISKPDKKIFIVGDIHSDMHDRNVLDIQESICKDYCPDICVNIGDTHNYGALNHHLMDKRIHIKKDILNEAAQTHYILKRMSSWAKESYILYGNHERFGKDFVDKYPQFGEFLDLKLLCDVESLGYKLVPLKSVLRIGSTKFIHGDFNMYGQSGAFMEKVAKTFGEDVFVGHIHYPAIRFGCYSVGLSGLIDQEYNEFNATRWIHGFGLCNHFQGKSFSTTIAIIKNRCIIKNKTYKPYSNDVWKMKSYKARLFFDTK